jgi:hypothetical protein
MNNFLLGFLLLNCLSHSARAADQMPVLKGDLEWRICPKDKPIKGNINLVKNTKIYHQKEDSLYSRTNPEACFETTEDAERNGFRHSLR